MQDVSLFALSAISAFVYLSYTYNWYIFGLTLLGISPKRHTSFKDKLFPCEAFA